MNVIEHKLCYGTLLPNPHAPDHGHAGKVFSLHLVGSIGMVRLRPQVAESREEWDDCLQCAEFESCYRLCMARLAVHALAETL